MRILMNINNILLCSQSHISKSSRLFQLNIPAATYVTGSRSNLNIEQPKLGKSFPKLAISNHVQRFMSTSSINSNSNKTNIKEPRESKYEDVEGVSIYEGKYTNQILRVKLFSLTTSAMGLIAQPILWQKGIEVSGTGLSMLICSVAGIFTFVTPLLLHFVTKKYAIDIIYNEKTDEYTCITVSFFLFKNKVIFFLE